MNGVKLSALEIPAMAGGSEKEKVPEKEKEKEKGGVKQRESLAMAGGSEKVLHVQEPNSANSSDRKSGLHTGKFLHLAGQGDVEGLEKMLEENVIGSVDQADYDGRTALHLACSEGQVEVVMFLLQLGADVNPKDRFGNTPLADAQSYGSAEICKLLKAKGAMVPQSGSNRHNSQIKKEDFEIDLEDLEIPNLPPIGKGIFGEVKKGTWRGTPVAVKFFNELMDESFEAEEEFKAELRILSHLRHPNVIQFLGAVTKKKPHMLVTEYFPQGNLYQILKRKGALRSEEAVKYALDIARGLNYLHEHRPLPVVHQDLTPHNLLRDQAGCIKVGDFGLESRNTFQKRLKFLADDSHHGSGAAIAHLAGTKSSYRYLAPEMFRTNKAPPSPSVDVFSFGTILYDMFEGLQKAKYKPEEVAAKYPDDESRPPFTSRHYPEGMTELISQCWAHDPEKRPTTKHVLAQLEEMQAKLPAAKPSFRRAALSSRHGASGGKGGKGPQGCSCNIL